LSAFPQQFSLATELSAMRGIIVLGLGLIIAFWIDNSYYDGMYSRETGNMIEHITKSFKH
jgi:hypothetical protein